MPTHRPVDVPAALWSCWAGRRTMPRRGRRAAHTRRAAMEGTVTTGSDPNEPRSVDGGQGVTWWTDAWALFTKNAAIWVVLGLILLIILLVLAFIPLVGQVAEVLLLPVFAGSWMLAAKKLESGGTLEVADLFSAFKSDKLTPLIVVGALFLAAMVVVLLV